MLKSRLNYHISFCELIEKLNEKGCLNVIRLLQQTMKFNDLNGLLIKILHNFSQQFPMDVLPDIYNKIEKIVEEESGQKQSRKTKITDNANSDVLFPLLKLPHDLISKTSFYLNENDIFRFEKCCRLFYQMINNTNYLNQNSNFETLKITNKKLNQMSNPKYSFFKYIKAQQLKFDFKNDHDCMCDDTQESINTFINELHNKWDKVKMVVDVDNVYTQIFKSIKSIDLDHDASLLLDKLPINILFDSKISNLEMIQMDHYWSGNNKTYLANCLKNFESQYLQLKKKLDQQGEEIHKLKLLKATDIDQIEATIIGPKYIIVNHLYLDNVSIDYFAYFNPQLKSDDHYDSINNIKILTIKRKFAFGGPASFFINWAKYDFSKFAIETLRIIDCDEHDILHEKKIIESFNLQNSLKNLTINLKVYAKQLAFCEEIKRFLDKEYFYKLENVNILFDIVCTQNDTIIHDIFAFFKKNRPKLKYQFKQFNIGLSQNFSDINIQTCHTFEWNASINDQFLDKQCNVCSQTQQMSFDRFAHEQKFNQWKNQWV